MFIRKGAKGLGIYIPLTFQDTDMVWLLGCMGGVEGQLRRDGAERCEHEAVRPI